jgi:hypothetical protein
MSKQTPTLGDDDDQHPSATPAASKVDGPQVALQAPPRADAKHPETSPAGQAAKANAEAADSSGAEVAEKMAPELEKGFRGVEVDPTPDAHYSVAGVTAGLGTPETDKATAAAAIAAQEHVERLAAGVSER